MAEQQNQSNTDNDGLKKVREAFIQSALLDNVKFRRQIEVDADKRYSGFVDVDDKHHGLIDFRRLKHEEVMAVYDLPFMAKLIVGEDSKLTDDEIKKFKDFQKQMLTKVIGNIHNWTEKLEDDTILSLLDTVVGERSGLDKVFEDNMNEFLSTDYGFLYGLVWFSMLGRTPSEIAKLPETDVKVVDAWIVKWAERLSKRNA